MPVKTKTPELAGGSPEALDLLATQSEEAANLQTQQTQTVTQLQTLLANGDINMKQYNEQIGRLFDEKLQQFQQDLSEQGRYGEAAGVPVGIGTLKGAAQRRYENEVAARAGTASPFSQPQGIDFVSERKAPKLPNLTNEDDQLLFGPTTRPDEPVTVGANRTGGGAPLPEGLNPFLPALLRMARSPDAPPQLQMLLAALTQHTT